MITQKRLILIVVALAFVFMCGTAGYMLIEKWRLLDAAYMTLITLTTIGFGEVRPLSDNGRIFTMFLIVTGVGILLYGISTFTAIIVEGHLMDLIRRRRMNRNIERLQDHYIICGAGNVGFYIVEEFIKTDQDFVVIDKKLENIKKLPSDVLWIEGDASDDKVLLKAGINKARGLIAALPTDKDNLFIVLTSRELNPQLKIVSRAIEEESINKLRKAGADNVVSTTYIGGMRIASEILRPTVTRFLDTMLRESGGTLRIEEVEIPAGARVSGLTLGELEVPKKTGLIVIAIKNGKSEQYVYNPPSSYELSEEDFLIVLGENEKINKLKDIVCQ